MTWLLSKSPPLPPASLLLAHMYQIPRLFFCPSNMSRLPLSQGFYSWPKKLFPYRFPPGWILVQMTPLQKRRRSIPTDSHSLTHHLAYYMPNSHHCLELSCTYLLTCLSISALTIYLSSLIARILFMLLSKGLCQGLAHCRYSINNSWKNEVMNLSESKWLPFLKWYIFPSLLFLEIKLYQERNYLFCLRLIIICPLKTKLNNSSIVYFPETTQD